MNRAALEHIIRASAVISGDDEIIVFGSQAILGQFPNAPPEMLVSDEADVYPKNHPDRAELIEGSIGELSPFHQTFGYYAQAVGPETASLPDGWQARLIHVSNPNTRGATAWCLEAHDLVISKLIAGREKDLDYAEAAVRHGLVDCDTLLARLLTVALDPVVATRAQERVASLRTLS